jgi:hypothetical protein
MIIVHCALCGFVTTISNRLIFVLVYISWSILGYVPDGQGSRVPFLAWAGNCSLHHRVQTGSGAPQHPIKWVPGALSLGVKWPGRETDHLPTFVA